LTVLAVTSAETGLGQALRSYSAELPERVAAIIEGTFKPAALAQLVSSQLDVDRMDYLLRDSLMTGAKYGLYDLEWIINALQIDQQGDRIYIAARGIFAVEEYLQARYYMFARFTFIALCDRLKRYSGPLCVGPSSWSSKASRSGVRRARRLKKFCIDSH